VSATRIDLACSPDGDDVGAPFTRILRHDNGAWATTDLDQQAQSLCQVSDVAGRTSLFVMSRDGRLANVDGGGPATKIEDAALGGEPYQLGFLNTLRLVGGALYAAGFGGQIYRRADDGAWRVLSEALLDGAYPDRNWILDYARNPKLLDDPETKRQYLQRLRSEAPKMFWALAGTSETSVDVGGEQAVGLLYNWDGARLSPCDLPTAKAVRDILVAPDGTVWICGREGILLAGRDRRFEVVVDLGPQARFASLAWFDGRLYVGASSGPHALYVLDGQAAKPVETGSLEDAHTIQSAGSALWAVGGKRLARFDGRTWEGVAVPGVE
jgi:hypothetical protein